MNTSDFSDARIEQPETELSIDGVSPANSLEIETSGSSDFTLPFTGFSVNMDLMQSLGDNIDLPPDGMFQQDLPVAPLDIPQQMDLGGVGHEFSTQLDTMLENMLGDSGTGMDNSLATPQDHPLQDFTGQIDPEGSDHLSPQQQGENTGPYSSAHSETPQMSTAQFLDNYLDGLLQGEQHMASAGHLAFHSTATVYIVPNPPVRYPGNDTNSPDDSPGVADTGGAGSSDGGGSND